MSNLGRVYERQRIRDATESASAVAAKGNAGPAITNALFFQQLIFAVCNLAETVEWRLEELRVFADTEDEQ